MNKEYKINIFRAGYVLSLIFSPTFLALTLYGLYMVLTYSGYWVFSAFCFFFLLMAIGLNYFVFFVFNKLSIFLCNNEVTFKMPHFKKVFKMEDIYDIRRDYFNGIISYNIYYKDKNEKKSRVTFTQDICDSEELIKYFQKMSGIKMKNYGDLTIKDADSKPLVLFKKSYNLILTALIIFLFFMWPIIQSAKNRKKAIKLQEIKKKEIKDEKDKNERK
ncbi:MAG: hypothetical protein KBD53_05570 [Candidatus Omnitrophica bacterium]|nr:hypothetical protein [Candidatus Omnitrophota bacterium]